MGFYFTLAIITGVLFILYSIPFIFKTKMYTKKYDFKHFEKSELRFRIYNAIVYIVIGAILLACGILAFIPSLDFKNHDLVYTCIFIACIAFALLFTIVLETVFIESDKKR